MANVADTDERDSAPHFTPEQILYLERLPMPPLYTPTSVDSTVALLGVIGERKGKQDMIAHLRSLQQTKG